MPTLAGIPDSAWQYRLGSRSTVEWVLDQYKERKPRDPTTSKHFNTYRIVDQLAELSNIEPNHDQQSAPQAITVTSTNLTN